MKNLFATIQKGFLIGESVVFFTGAIRCYKSNLNITNTFTAENENPELPNSGSYRSFYEESKTNKNSVVNVRIAIKMESHERFENRFEI